MEVHRLIEQLQDLVEHSSVFPWPGRRAVAYEEFYRLTEEIRRLLPQELAQATAIMTTRDEVLAGATRQAQEIVEQAQREAQIRLEAVDRQAADMVSQEAVTLAAEAHARTIVADAETEAARIRAGADEYALALLGRLDAFVQRVQQSIAEGRESFGAVPPAEAPSSMGALDQ